MSRLIAMAQAGLLLAVGLTACDVTSEKNERPAARDAERMDRGYASTPEQRTVNDPISPLTQGNNPADLETTRVIRRALLDTDGLSMAAQNITIITNDQVVTLRGAVANTTDRDAILAAAHVAAGKNRVDNRITIEPGKTADNR